MSSRREVLVRILALLQRKTLIETKCRTLKWHYWTVRSIKNVALLTEDGAFALFFRPHPGRFASSRVPTPGNLPSKAKKMLISGGQPGGSWAQVELTDALMAGRHRCTSHGGVTLSTGWLCQKWKLLDVLGTHLHKKRSCLWAF